MLLQLVLLLLVVQEVDVGCCCWRRGARVAGLVVQPDRILDQRVVPPHVVHRRRAGGSTPANVAVGRAVDALHVVLLADGAERLRRVRHRQ